MTNRVPVVVVGSKTVPLPVGDKLTDPDGDLPVSSSGSAIGLNRLVNGGFDIWQRGGGNFTSNEYTADHWKAASGSTRSHTVSRQSFTVGQSDVDGEPKYYLRCVVGGSGGSSAYTRITQPIEGIRTLADETVTVSFDAKASSSMTLGVTIRPDFGSGGSSNDVYINGTPETVGTSWARHSASLTVPSWSGKTIGTGDHLALHLWATAGSALDAHTGFTGGEDWDGTFDIANVKIEQGSSGTEFQKRLPGEEKRLCKRYFERFDQSDVTYSVLGLSLNTTEAYFRLACTEKRVAPAISTSTVGDFRFHGSAGTWIIPTSVAGSGADRDMVRIKVVGSGLGQGNANALYIPTDGYIDLDAEF